jgi:hypothetical protein
MAMAPVKTVVLIFIFFSLAVLLSIRVAKVRLFGDFIQNGK